MNITKQQIDKAIEEVENSFPRTLLDNYINNVNSIEESKRDIPTSRDIAGLLAVKDYCSEFIREVLYRIMIEPND